MRNLRVKLSYPDNAWPISRQLPKGNLSLSNCDFLINTSDKDIDFWFVYENLLDHRESANLKGESVFIAGEPPSVKRYENSFLSQFDTVITCQNTLKHKNIIHSQQGLPWHVGRSIIDGKDIFTKDYDELKNIKSFKKTKLISVISSNKVFTEGHRKRLDFVYKLKEHFGDQIDLFGRGINDISDKWDAIADYKYHIVLENSCFDDYWTEKLADCYLGGAFPFYYGCPNLEDYFSKKSFLKININDLEGSIKIIETAIKDEIYEKNIKSIMDSRDLVLDEYNIFAVMAKYCNDNIDKMNKQAKSKKITAYNQHSIIFKLKDFLNI